MGDVVEEGFAVWERRCRRGREVLCKTKAYHQVRASVILFYSPRDGWCLFFLQVLPESVHVPDMNEGYGRKCFWAVFNKRKKSEPVSLQHGAHGDTVHVLDEATA